MNKKEALSVPLQDTDISMDVTIIEISYKTSLLCCANLPSKNSSYLVK